ncbi:hypothetical protein P8X30_03965 [Pyrococcus kukulkanii]
MFDSMIRMGKLSEKRLGLIGTMRVILTDITMEKTMDIPAV